MSTGSINPLSNSYIQSILTSAIQGTGLKTSQTSNTLSDTNALSSVSQSPDNSRLSPFAQVISDLQQLQQSNPDKYKLVTQQIASNLQTAAQTAQTVGNTTSANQLNQLSADFTNASTSGQLPNIQDVANAVGGGHHYHHHHTAIAASDGTSSSTSTSSANQTLSQLLAAFQTGNTQSDAPNPMNIIMNTLSSAGITGS